MDEFFGQRVTLPDSAGRQAAGDWQIRAASRQAVQPTHCEDTVFAPSEQSFNLLLVWRLL
jgi:hypothetical protein